MDASGDSREGSAAPADGSASDEPPEYESNAGAPIVASMAMASTTPDGVDRAARAEGEPPRDIIGGRTELAAGWDRRAEAATPRREPPPRVSLGTKLGLAASLLIVGVGVLVPLVLLVWGGFAVAVSALAGTTLVHTGGLEPSTFGPSMMIGLTIAALLIAVVAISPAAQRSADAEAAAQGRTIPRSWGSRHPALATALKLLAVTALCSLAASVHSPFFPYPLATIAVVATLAFLAVISLVVAYRGLRALTRWLYTWSYADSYRAGAVTAACLLLGAAGGVAGYLGWTTRPAWLLAHRLGVDEVDAPDDPVEAGETVLCLGAAQLSPTKTSSTAAPACGAVAIHVDSPESCFKAILAGPYQQAVRYLRSRFAAADPENIASDAAVTTCMRSPLPDNARAFFHEVAKRRGARLQQRDRERAACDRTIADTPACRLDLDSAACMNTFLRALAPQERLVAERYLEGWTYPEIEEALGLPRHKAKNIFNYAVQRTAHELRRDCQFE